MIKVIMLSLGFFTSGTLISLPKVINNLKDDGRIGILHALLYSLLTTAAFAPTILLGGRGILHTIINNKITINNATATAGAAAFAARGVLILAEQRTPIDRIALLFQFFLTIRGIANHYMQETNQAPILSSFRANCIWKPGALLTGAYSLWKVMDPLTQHPNAYLGSAAVCIASLLS